MVYAPACNHASVVHLLYGNIMLWAYDANGGDTQSRNLCKKLAQVSCASFLHQMFVQVLVQETFITNMADKADRDAAAAAVAVIAVLAHEKLTSRKRKRNVWIKNENSGSDRPADQSELTILVTCMQVSCVEQSCAVFGARNLYKKNLVHAKRSSFLYKSNCTVSWLCVTTITMLTKC